MRVAGPRITPAHSPDGLWWWNGTSWLPAYGPDRRWWFDGTMWIRTQPTAWQRLRLPTLEWLTLLSVRCWLLFRAGAAADWTTIPTGYQPWLATSGAASVLGTITLGAWVGRLRLWSAVPLMALSGGGVLGCWYVAMMAASTPADADGSVTDLATGAGLVLFGTPAVAGLLVLLYAGALIGRVTGRARDRGLPVAVPPVGIEPTL